MGKVFLALAVCVAAFIGLLIIMSMELFSLPKELITRTEMSILQWQDTSREAISQTLSATEKLAEHERVFAAYSDEWSEKLSTLSTLKDTGTESALTLETLLATNSPSDRNSVETTLKKLNDSSTGLRLLSQDVAAPIITMTGYILQREKLASECRTLVESLNGRALTAVENQVHTAAQDWPEKKTDLQARLVRIQARGKQLLVDLAICEKEAAKDSEDIDIVRFCTSINAIRKLAKSPRTQEQELQDLCQQLYTGWDEILTDMNIIDGESVTFSHTVKKITINNPASDKDQVVPEQQEITRTISRQEYEKHKEHLGMALRTKAVGHYNHEVTSVAQPAGYTYIAKPEEKSNRYGEWRNDRGGESYWAWYGRYSFMRSLYWGSYYRPIYYGGYHSYYGHYSSGRSYYGSSLNGRNRYGSSGSYTSRRYSSSSYVKSGGYKSSRYVKSGGTYRGSPRRTSSSSYRSSSSGGSRSGGGK